VAREHAGFAPLGQSLHVFEPTDLSFQTALLPLSLRLGRNTASWLKKATFPFLHAFVIPLTYRLLFAIF
jgi:hypothetical protein